MKNISKAHILKDAITDVPGIKVGHSQVLKGGTGCTVILCEKGAVGGVDVRGGAPGTRETDLLNPVNLVDKVHAIYLGGGSAFGLDGASGVMKYLEESVKFIVEKVLKENKEKLIRELTFIQNKLEKNQGKVDIRENKSQVQKIKL